MKESAYQYFPGTVFESVYDADRVKELPASLQILGFADAESPFIPEKKDYVFRSDVLCDVLGFLRKPNGDALLLTGPTGSGKTSIIEQVCARLNWPVSELTLNSRFDSRDLIGHFTLQSKVAGATPEMQWVDGPLPRAMKAGHVLILNEYDLADPGELAALNDILEGKPLVIAENAGEVIHAHPMFRVVLTGNSIGQGDAGHYSGVQTQNIAFLDRFRVIKVDYQEPGTEVQLLTSLVPAIAPLAKSMVDLAQEVRKLFEAGELAVTLSTRTLVRWAHITSDFRNSPSSVAYGLERALLNRAEPEEGKAILSIAQTIFGDVIASNAQAELDLTP